MDIWTFSSFKEINKDTCSKRIQTLILTPIYTGWRFGLRVTSLGATPGAIQMKQKCLKQKCWDPTLTSPRHQASLLSLNMKFKDLWCIIYNGITCEWNHHSMKSLQCHISAIQGFLLFKRLSNFINKRLLAGWNTWLMKRYEIVISYALNELKYDFSFQFPSK